MDSDSAEFGSQSANFSGAKRLSLFFKYYTGILYKFNFIKLS